MDGDTKIAEVIEASTADFVAQAYTLNEAPAFGSFVVVREGDTEIVGVVSQVTTGSIEPGRRPVPRGRNEATADDVYKHNPELPELLRTEFTSTIVGFRDGTAFRNYLPPCPPRIHAFVYPCPPKTVVAFTEALDFIRPLLSAQPGPLTDELVAAAIRQAGAARPDDYRFCVAAGKELACLLASDIPRLTGILRRIGQ